MHLRFNNSLRATLAVLALLVGVLTAFPAAAEQAPLTTPEVVEVQQICTQVIVYGKNPGNGNCTQYATPCDVPPGWSYYYTLEDCQAAGTTASTLSTPEVTEAQTCIQVITYGKHPGTGECREYPTPCDVPNGWASYYSLEECQAAGS